MIYFLIPVFNEEKNIQNLFLDLSKVLPEHEKQYVFSDDGSTDKSIEEINRCFSQLKFTILSDGKNHGPGKAFNVGFEWIIKNSASEQDSVVTLEADNTSDLTVLPHLICLNKLGYSLVLASVYAQGGGFDRTSFFRKFISYVANLFFRFLFDVKVLTLSSFYRCYDINLLKKIYARTNGQIIREPGFICMLEILLKAIRIGAKIIEVPVILQSSKRVGKSKMNLMKTTFTYLRFLIEFSRNK